MTKWWLIFGEWYLWTAEVFEEMDWEYYFYNLDWADYAERG